MPEDQPRVRFQGPAVLQAVGMHYQQALPSADVIELLHFPHLRADRPVMRDQSASLVRVARSQVPRDVAHADVFHHMALGVDPGGGNGGASGSPHPHVGMTDHAR